MEAPPPLTPTSHFPAPVLPPSTAPSAVVAPANELPAPVAIVPSPEAPPCDPPQLAPPHSSHQTHALPLPKPSWSSILLDEVEKVRARPTSVSVEAGIAHTAVPEDIFVNQMPLWTSYIVGHFIGDEAPHIGKVHATVNRLWTTTDKKIKIDAQFLKPKTALFKIENAQIRQRVLRRHIWHISDIPMVVQEWTPTTANGSPDLSALPLWVDFANVPDQLFSKKGLMFLGDVIGNAQKLHPSTERCMRLDVARVLVEMNLNKELPKQICLNSDPQAVIHVNYPWLPSRCLSCNSWGHKEKECSQMGKGNASNGKSITVLSGKQDLNSGGSPRDAGNSHQKQATLTGKEKVIASITEVDSTGCPGPALVASSDFVDASKVGSEAAEQSIVNPHPATETHETPLQDDLPSSEQHWQLVTKNKSPPGKTVNTQVTNSVDPSLHSPSRFSVLAHSLDELPDKEEGEIPIEQSQHVSSVEGTAYLSPPKTRRGGGQKNKSQLQNVSVNRNDSSKAPRKKNNNKSSSRRA